MLRQVAYFFLLEIGRSVGRDIILLIIMLVFASEHLAVQVRNWQTNFRGCFFCCTVVARVNIK